MGYPEEQRAGTFQMIKVKAKTICHSCDEKWLGKSCGEYFGTIVKRNTEDTQNESSDNEEIEPT